MTKARSGTSWCWKSVGGAALCTATGDAIDRLGATGMHFADSGEELQAVTSAEGKCRFEQQDGVDCDVRALRTF